MSASQPLRIAALDASVVLHWFSPHRAASADAAASYRDQFEHGDLVVLCPPLLHLEVVNVAGRRWGWGHEALLELAATLTDLQFELLEPDIASVAEWVGRGLTAYDGAYVAVAEWARVPLITDDATILQTAPGIAVPLIA